MLSLNSVKKSKARKSSKRFSLGWGAGSKTAGRGTKGQKSRSGSHMPYAGFEGGQTPLYIRLPKRGFRNPFRTEYVPVGIGILNKFEEGSVVGPEQLLEIGAVRNASQLVKIVANGELTKKLTVKAHGFSQTSISKIKSLGGTVEEL
ncbi:MAG: 50S ribosomal protein L15 [Candidatus Cloacimonadota bacterium]|nr:MAG: 50S ribosomal protein L15 [Candidatus Cloacimonadota bacterium]